ncbi:MAG: sigma-70 family RNA polymerase sigma factor [Pirellulales bacterium]
MPRSKAGGMPESPQPAAPRKSPPRYADLDGKQLVALILQGDADALMHVLLDRCGDFLELLENTFDYQEDLAQDVCVHLYGKQGDWARLRSWDGSARLESWMMTVMRRVCLTAKRKSRNRNRLNEPLTDAAKEVPETRSPSPSLNLERSETITILLKAVEKLKLERDRLIILLRYLREPPLEPDELCERLSIRPGTLRTAESRARERLAEVLAGGEWEEIRA